MVNDTYIVARQLTDGSWRAIITCDCCQNAERRLASYREHFAALDGNPRTLICRPDDSLWHRTPRGWYLFQDFSVDESADGLPLATRETE